MRRINCILAEPEYRNKFFGHISEEDFARLLTIRPISNEWLEALQSRKLLPTPALLSFALQQGKSAKSSLEAIATDIGNGKFDKTDQLHVETAYSRYVLEGPPTSKSFVPSNLSLQKFVQLPTEDSNVRVSNYDLEYVLEKTQETADEAVEVFNFITAQPNSRVPKLVIANQRYGSLFVIHPISDYLAKAGVHVINQTVSSKEFDILKNAALTEPARLSYEAVDWITTHKPDVFVVDGTLESERSGMARFPAAMLGYLNEFKAYNAARGIGASAAPREVERLAQFNPQHSYQFRFWTPDGEQQQFFVGDFRIRAEDLSVATDKETRKLTIMSSIGISVGGSHAYFDDPEDLASKEVLCFTKSGLGVRRFCDEEKALVSFAQQRMKETIVERLGQP